MNRSLLLFLMFAIHLGGLADPSVMADFKELNKIKQEKRLGVISQQEYWGRQDTVKARIEPIVKREFAKLADGELSPLARDLLENLETVDYYFCIGILDAQLDAYPMDIQTKVLKKVFDTVPDSQRGRILRTFLADLPRETFAGKEIQQWLVATINNGKPEEGFYFILTEESAHAVTKTAVVNMNQFSQMSTHSDGKLLPLLSIVFLASRGDNDAVKLLDSLLEQRDIKSTFDTRYIIPAAAMSGNEGLIKKILNIVTTDKRVRFFGENCIPPEISFAHEAAVACALTIEGFPAVGRWKYDEVTKEKVRKWIEDNPTYTVRLEDPRVFFGIEGF